MVASLTSVQIYGLIALVVSTPFLVKSLRNLYLANASNTWPKVSGTIIEMPIYGLKYNLLYEYTVNRTTHKRHRICFTNTGRPINDGARGFAEKYALNRIVDVFYNSENPKQSVLEPGRKDGLITAIIFLGLWLLSGCLALFNQELFLQIVGSYF